MQIVGDNTETLDRDVHSPTRPNFNSSALFIASATDNSIVKSWQHTRLAQSMMEAKVHCPWVVIVKAVESRLSSRMAEYAFADSGFSNAQLHGSLELAWDATDHCFRCKLYLCGLAGAERHSNCRWVVGRGFLFSWAFHALSFWHACPTGKAWAGKNTARCSYRNVMCSYEPNSPFPSQRWKCSAVSLHTKASCREICIEPLP